MIAWPTLEKVIADQSKPYGFLHLEYNDHHASYTNAREEYAGIDSVTWVSKDSRKQALAEDRVWSLNDGGKRVYAANLVDLIPAPEANEFDKLIRAQVRGEYGAAYLTFNGHLRDEEELSDWAEDQFREWVEWNDDVTAVVNSKVWEFQIYPNTPIGFNVFTASSLATIFKDGEPS